MILNKKFIVCGGNKGGVGKSFIATAVASLLLTDNNAITLIEADPTNPDIARRFSNHAAVILADISDRDGWISLLDELESIETDYIIMSLPAGMNALDNIYSLLKRTLESLKIDLNFIFCLSRQFDSIELIEKSMDSGLASFALNNIAIQNGFFGENEKFDRWRESKLRKKWLEKGFEESFLPELNHRLVDFLEANPMPLHLLPETKKLSTALRLDLDDWLNIAKICFASMISDPLGNEQFTDISELNNYSQELTE